MVTFGCTLTIRLIFMTFPCSLDVTLPALALSAVARLSIEFQTQNSEQIQKALLGAATDILDKTMPYPDLKDKLRTCPKNDQIAFLIAHRTRVAMLPPSMWKTPKIGLNQLPVPQYSGIRALNRALQLDFSAITDTWAILQKWLAPVWDQYPELREECFCWNSFGTTHLIKTQS